MAQVNAWKQRHRAALSARRREIYANNYGLIAKENERKRKERKPYQARASIMRTGMRLRSRKLNLPFDDNYFTIPFITRWLIEHTTCPCCGVTLDCNYKYDKIKKNNSPSIDRIKPEKGYTKDNVAIICWRCNNLKRDATPIELRKVVEWMESVW